MRPKALTAYYYYPTHWIHFNAALYTVHNSYSSGLIPCLVYQPVIMAVANSNTIICHILPGPHLYTWVESSNVDKLPSGAEGQKCMAMVRFESGLSA